MWLSPVRHLLERLRLEWLKHLFNRQGTIISELAVSISYELEAPTKLQLRKQLKTSLKLYRDYEEQLSMTLLEQEEYERSQKQLERQLKQNRSRSRDSKLLTFLSERFSDQWEDFEYVFRHLDDARPWELSNGTPRVTVELRYYRDWLYTWFSFLTAIALGSIKKAIIRLSR